MPGFSSAAMPMQRGVLLDPAARFIILRLLNEKPIGRLPNRHSHISWRGGASLFNRLRGHRVRGGSARKGASALAFSAGNALAWAIEK